jgi:hypothetical protein
MAIWSTYREIQLITPSSLSLSSLLRLMNLARNRTSNVDMLEGVIGIGRERVVGGEEASNDLMMEM